MRTRPFAASLLLAALFTAATPVTAQVSPTLSITPITWNIIGLDSNNPAVGPNHFPVGARVCSSVATTDMEVAFVWDSANPYINLRPGSLSTVTIPSIGAGECADAYFEVEVTRDAAAFETTRRYHITATDTSGSVSTPTPRELFVEYLISQSRNAIDDVLYGTDPSNLTSVAPGGEMNLVVGNTYTIQLVGHTATQGYEQLEAFINFPNTIFQILDVETTYSANTSPFVGNPHDQLYADACLWENDPNSPNYRSCVGGDYKSGGDVTTTYTIRIVDGGGTSETLSTLLYDFSGSSFHYNADFSSGFRIANLIDPTTAGISKTFSPNPTPVDSVTTLTFTLTNPNTGALGGYNFVDDLPAGLVVADTPGIRTSGCGTPTVTAVAGSSTITVSEAAVGANGSCVINVNVTAASTGTYTNTTENLFIDDIDTGNSATAELTVNDAPAPGTGLCDLTLARWNFESGMSTTAPAATTANVTASASAGSGLSPAFGTADNTITPSGTGSWRSNGAVAIGTPLNTANNDYFEFAIDTTGYTSVDMSFDASRTNNGPLGIALYAGTSATPPGTQAFATDTALATATDWYSLSHSFTSGLNASGLTYFRIYAYNSTNENPGSDLMIDNVLFTGCAAAEEPTITKAFSPDAIAVGTVSTLTFTLTNTNDAALTGTAFSDSLPAGVEVAATPAAGSTCGGTWAPVAGAATLTFSGGTIPANGSCTVSVDVTATTAGPHGNVSGFLSTTESGTTISSVATADLTGILPPKIAKQFDPSPILPGGSSSLTFTITNPNQDDALPGIGFSDTFPTSPGAMTVAATPNATTSGCGSPVFAPSAGAGSITFSGGTIAAGGTCIVSVDVTAPAIGTYDNVSGNVSHVINSETVDGNSASASLVIEPPSPSIGLLKQVGTSASGPWTTFVAVESGSVYYQFTIENTGDVPLSPVTITDDSLDVSSCNAAMSGTTLPAPVAENENHIVTCVVGPVTVVTGSHTNIATASGTYDFTAYESQESQATYSTTGLTVSKTAAEAYFTIAGDELNYSYLVTNNGSAPLLGPVTVTDDKVTVTCPAVNTVGDLDDYLDPGESVTCSATYTVTASDVTANSVTNTATATVDGVSSAPDTLTVYRSPADVSITKTLDTAGPFTTGQTITYTLVVANAGPFDATAIEVSETPTNLTITGVSGACIELPCTILALAAGANTTITVTATIDAAGNFDNTATAIAAEPDDDPTNNTDDTGNGGVAADAVLADVSVVKTLVTAGPFTEGQTIDYTIVVANGGPSTATGVEVSDIASNLTITSVSGGCVGLPCTIASLLVDTDVTINVTAEINAAGAFDNSATATATEDDPDLTNNTDDDGNGGTALAATAVDLEITKTTSSDSVAVGERFTFTLAIVNHGPDTATGVTVSDPLPSDFEMESVTSSQGTCSGTTTISCSVGTMVDQATMTITIAGRATAEGSLENIATVESNQSEAVMSNNSSTASLVASQAVAGIPTVGETGLLLMALLLGIAGAVQITFRR